MTRIHRTLVRLSFYADQLFNSESAQLIMSKKQRFSFNFLIYLVQF